MLAKKCDQALEVGKFTETEYTPEFQKGMSSCHHLDFSSMKPIMDF
jgi:hypothetical protein